MYLDVQVISVMIRPRFENICIANIYSKWSFLLRQGFDRFHLCEFDEWIVHVEGLDKERRLCAVKDLSLHGHNVAFVGEDDKDKQAEL